MSVVYMCPHCHRSGKVADRFANQPATCPDCRELFTLPPVSADDEPPATDAGFSTDRPGWIINLVLWVVCLAGVVVCFALFLMAWDRANNVMQQAAVGVQFCFLLMAGFFAVYCLDRLLLGRR